MHLRNTLLCFGISLLLGARLGASLHEAQVSVHVSRLPVAAPLHQEIRVSAAEQGAQRLTISVTNTSGADLSLSSWTVEFPWFSPMGPNDRISTGGWDMGRSEARVWSPAAAEKVTTGSYLLAKGPVGYSLAAFTTWKTFNAKLRFAAGRVIVTGEGEGRLLRAGETVALETVW